MKKILTIVSALLLSSFPQLVSANDELCSVSNDDCTFVLLSLNINQQVSEVSEESNSTDSEQVTQVSSLIEENETLMLVNRDRANQRFSPLSTFKIPNSLIALDSKKIKDAQQALTFDKKKYPVQKWWPKVWRLADYNLSSAFKYSMVAIYRQVATDIGEETMQTYLNQFAYGNHDISSGLDNFWLNGSLQISALEQVRFLQKMHQEKLLLSQHSIDTLKEIMLVDSNSHYSLYAKTGAGKVDVSDNKNKAMLGWYVGFVENAQGVHYFAFNITQGNFTEMKSKRVKMAMNHLKAAGII